jgi:putative tryptophan/tyrosine transport system substrate-binding protein
MSPSEPLGVPNGNNDPHGRVTSIGRREFITMAWPLAPRAQQQVMPTIGFLDGGSQATALSVIAAFKQGLLDTGYVEGKNVMIEFRWANSQYDQLRALAADLVRHQVAVIATDTPVAALAAKQATTSISIVFGRGSGPVRTPNARGSASARAATCVAASHRRT